jgi:RNA polymerase sigma-70 factor (sigma-E family)
MEGPERVALEAAFRAHYVRLVRIAALLTGDSATAEDLVQEAFTRSRPFLPRLASDEPLPYLRQAVLNLWKNRQRRLSLERKRAQSIVPDPAVDPEAAWTTHLDVLRALSRLSARQRACVVLRYYEDMTEQDVANVLGVSLGSVKRHTDRALKRLREELT